MNRKRERECARLSDRLVPKNDNIILSACVFVFHLRALRIISFFGQWTTKQAVLKTIKLVWRTLFPRSLCLFFYESEIMSVVHWQRSLISKTGRYFSSNLWASCTFSFTINGPKVLRREKAWSLCDQLLCP